MNYVDRYMMAQKKELQKAHNVRFTDYKQDYIIKYEGGLPEFISVYARPAGTTKTYRFAKGFPAYTLHSAEQVITKAKSLVGLK